MENELRQTNAELKHLSNKLSELARTDHLTGLANRRAFDEAIDLEFLRTKRFGSPTSLLMIDIDHFKKINDFHGHEAGDRALISLATTLSTLARATDLPTRFGGEEFVFLLRGSDISGAMEMAERIRLATEDLVIPSPFHAFKITVSIGGASFAKEDEDWSEALARADAGMYRAKELGRNGVYACMREAERPKSIS